MEKTVRESTCLRWTGATDKDGYPMFALSRAKSVVRGTRWLWEQVRGAIPPGPDGKPLQVCHTCDHPWCVEIEHMWLGTNAENTADRQTKRRTASGDQHYAVKLTDAEALAFHAEANHPEARLADLAAVYGISVGHAKNLRRGAHRRVLNTA